MDAGARNRRIQIQAQTTTQDDFGQPLESWQTIYTCWASIGVQNSQLVYSTAEFLDKVTHRIEMLWTRSVVIAANQRVVYLEPSTNICHTYNIEAVLNDKQGNYKLILMCYELGAQE